jgi:hypothetical protein
MKFAQGGGRVTFPTAAQLREHYYVRRVTAVPESFPRHVDANNAVAAAER